ncbi:GTP cyclohydrolase I FolE2 [Bdellovibrio sp. qaytius]|nr:GTP cyclohydrolase I FolE2 [Bdellovibrio sp. qaytius]
MITDIKSDIMIQKLQTLQSLDWVGMQRIQSSLRHHENLIPCDLALGVDLKEGNRGIHMSRLYSLMIENFLSQELTTQGLDQLLQKAITSQEGLSTYASLNLAYKLPIHTQALKSGKEGFRNYDVSVSALKEDGKALKIWLKFAVLYSSTCPQSAALSVETFNAHFAAPVQTIDRLPATPHAQRSVMDCELLLEAKDHFDVNDLMKTFIQIIENTLKTPVQTAVKKADEMAFAILNSENLMFCEDAVRKIDTELKTRIQSKPVELVGYRIKTRHEESLHPHDAVSQKSYNYTHFPN